MKKIRPVFIALIVLLAFLASSCSPQIYGQNKRKKRSRRDCGCEWIAPEKENVNSLDHYAANH